MSEAKKNKRKGERSNSSAIDEVYEAVISKMNRDAADRALAGWPPFPQRFHLLRDSRGKKSYLQELDDLVVREVLPDAVEDAIINYTRNVAVLQGTPLSPQQARACFQIWGATTPSLPSPPLALAEKSVPGYAFTRLAFDAPVDSALPSPPPAFEDILSRCTQPLAVAAFIGSLFFPEADRSQYLYLFGEGNDGKGVLLRFLQILLGGAAQALQPPEDSSSRRFFNHATYGKRLVYFPDCDSPDFFASAQYKSLTGGDAIYFEPKGLAGFTGFPSCKFIAASNIKPHITSQRSDQRRLIFSQFTSVPASMVIPKFEERLTREAESIVRWCKATYLDLAPSHGPIRSELTGHVAAEAEEQFNAMFHRHFEVDPDSWVAGSRVQWVFKEEGIRNNKIIPQIKAVWARTFGVRVETATSDGRKGCLNYVGMKWAPKDFSPLSRTAED